MRLIKALIVTAALVLGTSSLAQAAKGAKKADKTSTVNGTVVGYQEHSHAKKLVVSVTNDDNQVEERSIRLDDSTKITLDGQTVTASALRAGEKVTINLTKKTATQVTATSK